VTGDQYPGFDGLSATRRRAWYVVLLLMSAQIFSYIDRFLPSLLLAPIKADLGLSDFQLGLMLGPAFGLFYVFIGVPIGWLADRYSRRALIAAGIGITANIACAFHIPVWKKAVLGNGKPLVLFFRVEVPILEQRHEYFLADIKMIGGMRAGKKIVSDSQLLKQVYKSSMKVLIDFYGCFMFSIRPDGNGCAMGI